MPTANVTSPGDAPQDRLSFLARGLTVAATILLASFLGPTARLAAQCGANPIVCENQLTGTAQSQWDISGSGDASLQGFTTDISVNVGETVHFRVDTTALTFNMDIYRLG